jgi:hypothetical protein
LRFVFKLIGGICGQHLEISSPLYDLTFGHFFDFFSHFR